MAVVGFVREAFDLSENPRFASSFRADCTTELDMFHQVSDGS